MSNDEEIHITIDGVQVRTRPGKMVLEAAMEGGVYIPYLCYHPGMKPFAACRMCVVEVEGGRGYPASCTLPVQDGMVLKNDSREVYELRRSIMDMLLSEHPHGCLTCHRVDLCGPQDICLRHVSVNDRCVTCPKNERCELKDTTRFLNMDLESPLAYKYRSLPVDTGDPFYDRDYNLCIVCGRCVRVCEELRGDNAITFTERGGRALVGTSHGTSLLESGCEFCGACLDVCPVGALVESDNKWEKANRVERTICPLCPVGCQMNLEVNQFNKVIRVIPELSAPANRGQACFKGKFGLDFVNRKERLKKPLIRRGNSLEEASWEEALDYIAERLPKYKGSRFAILTSPDSTNEEHYVAQKFARAVMVTNNVDQTSDTRPELVNGLLESVGIAAATNPIWDLDSARCILAFNTNVTEEHNVAAVPVKRAAKAGAKLVVIDPREVELTRYAHVWLRPRPGTELLLLGGLLKEILDKGLDSTSYDEEDPDNAGIEPQPDALKQPAISEEELIALTQTLQGLDMDFISRETGVIKDLIEEAANLYATSGSSAILYALDNIPLEVQRDCVLALADLAILTGNLGKPSTGLYPLRQGANEQGAWDMGCVPHLLPGYRDAYSAQDRQAVEDSVGTMVPIEGGLNVRRILESIAQDEIKAMFVVGQGDDLTNGALSDWSRPAESQVDPLGNLDLLVVQDHFLSPLAQGADVVLPRSTFAEKTGTLTNLERRVQFLKPVLELKNSEARPEWWTICQIAQRTRAAGFDFQGPAEIMEEIAMAVPQYAGISHQRLEGEGILVARPDTDNPLPVQVLYSDKEYRGIQWPCTTRSHIGTPILYADGSLGAGDGGRPRLVAPKIRSTAASAADDYSLLFVPGRVLLQPERDMELVKGRLNKISRQELVELNPEDAQRLGVEEGDIVEVRTNGLNFNGKAALVATTPKGSVSSTGLFGQLAVDLETSEEYEPMSKVPGLGIAPAELVKVAH